MKNNKILKSIIKWMPLYLVMLFFMFINRYVNRLTNECGIDSILAKKMTNILCSAYYKTFLDK